MSKLAAPGHDAAPLQVQDYPTPEEIRHELERILASPAFHGSKRCQRFLDYVCTKALSGEAAALKERTVAIEVFDRQPQSDLSEDTIVRVGAREVRKRLAQYYVTPEGEAAKVRVEMPPGSYAPEFRYAAKEKGREEERAAEAPSPVRGKRRGLLWIWAVAVIVIAGVAVAVAVTRRAAPDANQAPFARFWAPVFQSPEPLLLAVAHPLVYHPSLRALKMSESRLPPLAVPGQRPIDLPAKDLSGSDMVPVFNQYVGFGDLMTATDVAAMLAQHSKTLHVRLASSVAFADLRQTPALLIGGFTNRWTMELEQSWRFQFSRTADLRNVIVDTGGGREARRGEWSIESKQDGSAPEDYMLICRVHSSFTGALVLVAAGVKQFGTEAAGRLLTDPDQLSAILRALPAGWEDKNLQLVLHARVIGNTAAQPEVVAWHLWDPRREAALPAGHAAPPS